MAVKGKAANGINFEIEYEHRSEFRRGWRRFRANRAALVGLGFIIFIILIAVFADYVSPYDPIEIVSGKRGVAPSWEHPFGWDHVGRDLLSRVIHGSQVALLVGLVASAVAIVIGVTIGAAAGFFGGGVDAALMRLTDTLMAFPLIALMIMLASVLGPSLITTLIVIGTTTWSSYARVVRADVMSLKEQEFIVAARACGVRDWRIIWRHILPNVLAPVIVLATLGVGSIIIFEAALSFLGLGIQPPRASWGRTLADGRAHITRYPHICIAPGVMIFLTVLAFNLFGDGLRDALDPRQQDRS
jgi:peptide/nickel transport system permease protein